jgi:hypothetical protein
VPKEPAGAVVEVGAELVGEALEVSETEVSESEGDGDSGGLALAEVLPLEGAVVTDGAELAVPLAQAVRASSVVAAPAAVAAIDRRAPRAACTPPVSSRCGPRHHVAGATAPDRDSGDLGG